MVQTLNMAQLKQRNLAVPCKNSAAHARAHLIPIPEHFKNPTAVKCDLCGKVYEYAPEVVTVDFSRAP